MNWKFVETIEKTGYINRNGEKVTGTASLLHFLHIARMMNLRLSELDPRCIARGKAYMDHLISR